MEWNKALIKYWCEHYYQLRNYELNPFETYYIISGLPFLGGSKSSLSPYEETCDLNWEFDKALTKLGKHSKIFKLVYLNGGEPTKESMVIYNEFSELLMEENDG